MLLQPRQQDNDVSPEERGVGTADTVATHAIAAKTTGLMSVMRSGVWVPLMLMQPRQQEYDVIPEELGVGAAATVATHAIAAKTTGQ